MRRRVPRVRMSGWIRRGAPGVRRHARGLPRLTRRHSLSARRGLLLLLRVLARRITLLGRRVSPAVVPAHVLLSTRRHPTGDSGTVAVGRVSRRPHSGSVVLRVAGVSSGSARGRGTPAGPHLSTRAHLVVHHVRRGAHLLGTVRPCWRPTLRSRRCRPRWGRPVALGRHRGGRAVGRWWLGCRTAGRPRGHR